MPQLRRACWQVWKAEIGFVSVSVLGKNGSQAGLEATCKVHSITYRNADGKLSLYLLAPWSLKDVVSGQGLRSVNSSASATRSCFPGTA